MAKGYKDRSMRVGVDNSAPVTVEEETFFFPKHVPPVVIKANSKEEAEKKLAALDK